MSGGTIKSGNLQVGQDGTASNNFTWYQPAIADGTVRLGVGVAGATTSDAVTVTNAGNVGIGTTGPGAKITISGSTGSLNRAAQITPSSEAATIDSVRTFALQRSGNDTQLAIGYVTTPDAWVISSSYGSTGAFKPLAFATSDTERMRIDSSGNVGIGASPETSTQRLYVLGNKSSQGASSNDAFIKFSGASGVSQAQFMRIDDGNYNAAACGFSIGRNSSTLRSINAGGTVNASGADYAEYMTKAGDFTIAKGDIAGIDVNGKLTNMFENAISFVVKSTDPSYVGGDSWGTHEILGGCPEDINSDEYTQYLNRLEEERQKVDRIAFSGQVPVNVLNAVAGQYIIPVNDNGLIKGEAVSNPTFEQYQMSVGKVIAIEKDGRAKIIVKVA